MSERILVGKGYLNFNTIERQSDRYGTVRLFTPPEEFGRYLATTGVSADELDSGLLEKSLPFTDESLSYAGRMGRLIAVITNSRVCQHIGDLGRKIYPPAQPLPIGSEVVLSETGRLFFEQIDKPKYGFVFKCVHENKEYFVLLRWGGEQTDPNVEGVTDEKYMLENKSMGLDKMHVVQIWQGNSLNIIAEVCVERNGKKTSVYEMLQSKTKAWGEMIESLDQLILKDQSTQEDYQQVGIRPEIARSKDWLNPHAIYQALQQDVELYFECD